jgi:hypothetical protein
VPFVGVTGAISHFELVDVCGVHRLCSAGLSVALTPTYLVPLKSRITRLSLALALGVQANNQGLDELLVEIKMRIGSDVRCSIIRVYVAVYRYR